MDHLGTNLINFIFYKFNLFKSQTTNYDEVNQSLTFVWIKYNYNTDKSTLICE